MAYGDDPNDSVFRYGGAESSLPTGAPEIQGLEFQRRTTQQTSMGEPVGIGIRDSFAEQPDFFQEFPRVETYIPPTEEGSTVTGWKFNRTGGLELTVLPSAVYTQGYFVGAGDAYTPADKDLTLSDDATNYIYLTITRDATSRELSSGDIEAFDEPQESDDTMEYHLVAKADTQDGVIASIEVVRPSELRTLETIVVINGELKYAPLDMSTANYYDIPSPPPPP